MDGRINVAEAHEIMVSRRPPNPVEKANPAWTPRPNSPLENTPHNARVIRDVGAIAASGTTVDVTAERSRTAMLDGVKDSQMLIGQPRTVVLDEGFPELSNDVRHLEGWLIHDRFCSLRERFTLSGLETSIWSSGFGTAVRCFRERCR